MLEWGARCHGASHMEISGKGLQQTTSIRRLMCPALQEPETGRVLEICRSHALIWGSEWCRWWLSANSPSAQCPPVVPKHFV